MALTPEYAAGFFDGEGCVNFQLMRYRRYGKVRGRSISLRVMIGNTNLAVLRRFEETFGGSVHPKPRYAAQHKPTWVWAASFKQAVPFLLAIQPFVIVKTEQVALALEFAAWRGTGKSVRCDVPNPGHGAWVRRPDTLVREEEFKQRMHDLNRRGIPAVG